MVAEERLRAFMNGTFSGVLARAWALRSSVVAFGIGIALLPIGFLKLSDTQVGALVGVSVFFLVLYTAIDFGSSVGTKDTPPYGTIGPLAAETDMG